MTNKLALILGGIIAVLIAADLTVYDGANLLFLGKKLYWLIDYVAFWR
ncbi:hypothetical protein [Sagittula sp.]